MYSLFKQKNTYYYLASSIILIIAALTVGIDDNPPGILLSFLSSVLFILAFTHDWKRAKPYVLLTVASLVSFAISAILHNVFEAIGKGTFLEIIGVIFFLLAIFICPAGILIGIVGSLFQSFKRRKMTKVIS